MTLCCPLTRALLTVLTMLRTTTTHTCRHPGTSCLPPRSPPLRPAHHSPTAPSTAPRHPLNHPRQPDPPPPTGISGFCDGFLATGFVWLVVGRVLWNILVRTWETRQVLGCWLWSPMPATYTTSVNCQVQQLCWSHGVQYEKAKRPTRRCCFRLMAATRAPCQHQVHCCSHLLQQLPAPLVPLHPCQQACPSQLLRFQQACLGQAADQEPGFDSGQKLSPADGLVLLQIKCDMLSTCESVTCCLPVKV